MKSKHLLYLFVLSAFVSCKKNNIIDSGISEAAVNLTTYDYLKAKPQFKLLVSFIDKGNLRDAVNSSKTFFAPTDVAFGNFVRWQLSQGGGNRDKYSLDSITPKDIDSLKLYMYSDKITRDDFVKTSVNIVNGPPKYYAPFMAAQPNTRFKVWLLRDDDASPYTPIFYMAMGKVIGEDDILYKEATGMDDIFENRDRTIGVQTSGIITTTGMLHVLANNHVYLFK